MAFELSASVIIVLIPASPDAIAAISMARNASHVAHLSVRKGWRPQQVLLWDFDVQPKDLGRGLTFGSDSKKCDIQLPSGIVTTRHFSINFNPSSGILLVINNSSHGLVAGKRHLGNRGASQVIEHGMTIVYNDYKFIAYFKERGRSQQLYDERLRSYLGFLLTGSPARVMSTHSTPLVVRERIGSYLEIAKLGKGGFGEVALLTHERTGDVFAAKSIRKERHNAAEIEKEISTLKRLRHPNIVGYVDSISENGKTFLIMEYLGCGDVSKQLGLEPPVIVEMLYQCLQALSYLHERGVTHRDIKPDNIAMQSRSPVLVKLVDFGLASVARVPTTQCGTWVYSAPEIWGFNGKPGYDIKVDIWSLGMAVLELFHHLPEREAAMFATAKDKTSQDAYIRAINVQVDKLPTAIAQFLRGMLQRDPRTRWTADECILKIAQVRQVVGHPPSAPANHQANHQPRHHLQVPHRGNPEAMEWEPTLAMPRVPRGARIETLPPIMPRRRVVFG